jgi:hypothetical protein
MNRLRSSLLLLFLASPAACGDGSGPGAVDVAGDYHATTFTLTRTGSPPADVLVAGGSMIAVLGEDGGMGANLIIPQSLTDDGQQLEIMLGGNWTRTENRLRFQDPQGDSFLEEMDWTVGSNTLSGTFVDIDGTIEITLTRDEPT